MKLIKQDIAFGLMALVFVLGFWWNHTYNKNINDNKKITICKVVGF